MTKSIALLAAALAVASCAGFDPSRGPTHSTAGRAFAERVAGLPVGNAARLDEGVWRGAAPGYEGLRALKERGIRTVVDLRTGSSERRDAEALGLRLVEIPLRADVSCDPPTEAQVRKFLDVVTDPVNQPVYVHCARGMDRTGTMCALYRMEVCGWTREEALEEMRAFGFHDWYADFLGFVQGYQCCGAYEAAAPLAGGR